MRYQYVIRGRRVGKAAGKDKAGGKRKRAKPRHFHHPSSQIGLLANIKR
jgi:hypothetical protein